MRIKLDEIDVKNCIWMNSWIFKWFLLENLMCTNPLSFAELLAYSKWIEIDSNEKKG